MKEKSKSSAEERIDILEAVLNKIAEEQVLIEDALKNLKMQIEKATTLSQEEAYKGDTGGININEEN